jgi:protein-S-isoprenylcysteine O-methyltransferase Ste14
MEIIRIIAAFLFLLLILVFTLTLIKVKRNGGELFGRPTLNIYAQFFSKLALLFPVLIFALYLTGIHIPHFQTPIFLYYSGFFIFVVAMLLLIFSLLRLGRFTKMGLPKKDKIHLQTRGIYRLSRNPMYLGLILLAISTVLMLTNPVSIILTIAGMIIHHRIILREEKYLESKFGQEYAAYRNQTRRYI